MGSLLKTAAAGVISTVMAVDGAEALTDREALQLVRDCQSASHSLGNSETTLRAGISRIDGTLTQLENVVSKSSHPGVQANAYKMVGQQFQSSFRSYDAAVERIDDALETVSQSREELEAADLKDKADAYCSIEGEDELQLLSEQYKTKKAEVEDRLKKSEELLREKDEARILAEEEARHKKKIETAEIAQRDSDGDVANVDVTRPPSQIVTQTLEQCSGWKGTMAKHFQDAASHANTADWYAKDIAIKQEAGQNTDMFEKGFEQAIERYNDAIEAADMPFDEAKRKLEEHGAKSGANCTM